MSNKEKKMISIIPLEFGWSYLEESKLLLDQNGCTIDTKVDQVIVLENGMYVLKKGNKYCLFTKEQELFFKNISYAKARKDGFFYVYLIAGAIAYRLTFNSDMEILLINPLPMKAIPKFLIV